MFYISPRIHQYYSEINGMCSSLITETDLLLNICFSFDRSMKLYDRSEQENLPSNKNHKFSCCAFVKKETLSYFIVLKIYNFTS